MGTTKSNQGKQNKRKRKRTNHGAIVEVNVNVNVDVNAVKLGTFGMCECEWSETAVTLFRESVR